MIGSCVFEDLVRRGREVLGLSGFIAGGCCGWGINLRIVL